MSSTTLTFSGHGLTLETGDLPIPVYIGTDGTLQKAKADDTETLAALYVTAISGDSVTLTDKDTVTVEDHGLVIGQYYFLSDSVEGFYQYHSGHVSQPIYYVLDETRIRLISCRPITKTNYKVTE